MSQQLLMWSVSPFMIHHLEIEGFKAFEIFWNADEDFNTQDYEKDYGIKLSESLKINAKNISNEAMEANERESIEIQGGYADLVHCLLNGDDDCTTLYGDKALDFIVREEVIGENSWCLVNALVGSNKVRDAEDYVASYLNPEETKNISLALTKIGDEDFEVRCNTLFSESQERRFVCTGDISEVEEFINSDLIPLYANASEQGYGILIAWSI